MNLVDLKRVEDSSLLPLVNSEDFSNIYVSSLKEFLETPNGIIYYKNNAYLFPNEFSSLCIRNNEVSIGNFSTLVFPNYLDVSPVIEVHSNSRTMLENYLSTFGIKRNYQNKSSKLESLTFDTGNSTKTSFKYSEIKIPLNDLEKTAYVEEYDPNYDIQATYDKSPLKAILDSFFESQENIPFRQALLMLK